MLPLLLILFLALSPLATATKECHDQAFLVVLTGENSVTDWNEGVLASQVLKPGDEILHWRGGLGTVLAVHETTGVITFKKWDRGWKNDTTQGDDPDQINLARPGSPAAYVLTLKRAQSRFVKERVALWFAVNEIFSRTKNQTSNFRRETLTGTPKGEISVKSFALITKSGVINV